MVVRSSSLLSSNKELQSFTLCADALIVQQALETPAIVRKKPLHQPKTGLAQKFPYQHNFLGAGLCYPTTSGGLS